MSTEKPERPPLQKVIELSIVTDIEIEKAINQAQGDGWQFQDIKFVVREASKRPAMAFLFFEKAE